MAKLHCREGDPQGLKVLIAAEASGFNNVVLVPDTADGLSFQAAGLRLSDPNAIARFLGLLMSGPHFCSSAATMIGSLGLGLCNQYLGRHFLARGRLKLDWW